MENFNIRPQTLFFDFINWGYNIKILKQHTTFTNGTVFLYSTKLHSKKFLHVSELYFLKENRWLAIEVEFFDTKSRVWV